MKSKSMVMALALTAVLACSEVAQVFACTGITLTAADGAVVYGRTMEWGSFDLHSRVVLVPRGYKFAGHTPDGKTGLSWQAKYGVVGLDAVGKDMLVDGMNEKGLTLGLFYHPGYAEYQVYNPADAGKSMGPTDLGQYLLSTCATVNEVRTALVGIHVVPVVEPALGITPGVHLLVTEPSGKAIVVEFNKGEIKVFDAPLGVITNAPNYDWHETNLRNYINLSPVALPGKQIGDLNFKPLGGGSGMIGLPGDFTPPSRFVRAVAFTKTARPTKTGDETIYELFRILDNFNVPLGASEGTEEEKTSGMRSSTLWTSGYDTKNLIMYYTTQNNRRVRRLDLKKLDFAAGTELLRQPMDKERSQDYLDVAFQK
jgi:choloylglycine hydrolase